MGVRRSKNTFSYLSGFLNNTNSVFETFEGFFVNTPRLTIFDTVKNIRNGFIGKIL